MYWKLLMTKQYDVIICGGGPTGSTAGLVLARQGFSVALLDKATFPRKKLCGGLLTWKSVKLLEAVHGETVEQLTNAGVINYASDHYKINTYQGALAEGDLPFPFHFVDRMLFDDHLLKLAASAGVEIFEDSKIVHCDPDLGHVVTEDGRLFEGQYVIGADGANSVIRNTFPKYNRERFKEFMAPTIEISFKLEDFPRPVEYPELVVGFLEAGYGWVFPNKDRVIVGICGLRRNKESFSKIFSEYLDFLNIDSNKVPELHGHPLPYGNYLGNPVHGRTLLAGDAGGFVEPLFGEGIFFALATGLYAGEAIADGLAKRTNPGPGYSSRLHRQVIPEIKASDRLRWTLFSGMKYLGPRSLGIFVNAGASTLAEMVHGMRSYSLLRKKRWDFM